MESTILFGRTHQTWCVKYEHGATRKSRKQNHDDDENKDRNDWECISVQKSFFHPPDDDSNIYVF
jgi:hypothetical protein